jgi:hypothetical protein
MSVMFLSKAVGVNCPNVPNDVKLVHLRLMEIGKIPCYPCQGAMDQMIMGGIRSVQKHFMLTPDGIIGVSGMTQRVLNQWSTKPIKPGANLPGQLRAAWDMVNPLLPEGSSCTSGYRSTDEQRRLLQRFYLHDFRGAIVSKYGQKTYDSTAKDLVANEDEVLKMVHGVGQLIAKPGTSPHEKMKAIDIGGPDAIDSKQVEVVKLVARANPNLLSGKVLRERNGCVHFEIR